jgi:hypothetical protein
MNVFAVFTTDAWHSTNSMSLMGLYSSKVLAVDAIREDLGKTSFPLSLGDEQMLEVYGQTQGREENWLIQTKEMDQPITT